MSQDVNFTITQAEANFTFAQVNLDFNVANVTLEFPQSLSQVEFTTEVNEINFVLSGNTGQAGGEEVPYAQEVDFIDGDPELIYRAEAPVGSATSASIWRIRKITIQNADGDIKVEWAGGSEAFNQKWDDHLSLSYS